MLKRKMNRLMSQRVGTLALVCTLTSLASFFSPSAFAQDADKWEYRASIYGYLPDVGGTTVFPAGSGSSGLGITAEQILDNLESTFMGTFDMHNGRWGLFSDLIYLDIDASKSRTNDFTLFDGGKPVSIPASTTADLAVRFKATLWTAAGEYRVLTSSTLKMDVLAGARMFKVKSNASWDINGNVGSWTGQRTNSATVNRTFWDGIVGIKGNMALGKNSGWSVPFYLDAGTGDSDLTWQAATGISYAFSWGEASAMWRHLAYKMKPDSAFQDVNFSGPMIGATFKF